MDPSRSRLFSSREGKKSKEETEKGTGQVKAGFASYQPEITRYRVGIVAASGNSHLSKNKFHGRGKTEGAIFFFATTCIGTCRWRKNTCTGDFNATIYNVAKKYKTGVELRNWLIISEEEEVGGWFRCLPLIRPVAKRISRLGVPRLPDSWVRSFRSFPGGRECSCSWRRRRRTPRSCAKASAKPKPLNTSVWVTRWGTIGTDRGCWCSICCLAKNSRCNSPTCRSRDPRSSVSDSWCTRRRVWAFRLCSVSSTLLVPSKVLAERTPPPRSGECAVSEWRIRCWLAWRGSSPWRSFSRRKPAAVAALRRAWTVSSSCISGRSCWPPAPTSVPGPAPAVSSSGWPSSSSVAWSSSRRWSAAGASVGWRCTSCSAGRGSSRTGSGRLPCG